VIFQSVSLEAETILVDDLHIRLFQVVLFLHNHRHLSLFVPKRLWGNFRFIPVLVLDTDDYAYVYCFGFPGNTSAIILAVSTLVPMSMPAFPSSCMCLMDGA
jgi:hypothetical protein